MLNSSFSSPKTKVLLGITGLTLVSFLFAGCSKQTAVAPENTAPTNQEATASPDTAMMYEPATSPVVKAQNTTEAETKESAQLDTLNKDASSVDQGLNDQAITVN